MAEPNPVRPLEPPSTLRRVGVLTACVYLLACLFYVRGPQVYTRTGRELFNWFCVLSLLFLFRKGYRAVKHPMTPPTARTLVGFAAVFFLLASLTFPFHSTDVFGYINRGWQQVHYGMNPYVYRLGDVPDWQQDPMLREHWVYNPNPYGFLFSLVARALCYAGGGNWWLTLFLFKAVNVAAVALTAWLVWSGARRLGHARPALALYLLLWNPLILMHHVANGHNDVLTGCVIVLAMYLVVTGRGLVWVIPALVAATLLKYAPAVMIPFALVHVYRRRGWKTAALSCLAGAAILAAVSAPYVGDWRAFRLEDIGQNATLIDNSLHSLLIHVYENVARLAPALAPFHGAADAAIKNTIRVGFLAFLVYQGLRFLRRGTAEELVERSLLVMFVLICVVSSKFNAWYMAILLPHALLLREGHWLRRLVVLISCAELLSLTFFKQAYMLNYFAMILLPAWYVYRRERRERAERAAQGARGADFRAAPAPTPREP